MNQPENKSKKAQPKLDPTIAAHVERLRKFALENPCISDQDFVRVFSTGSNKMLLDYNNAWWVSVIVSVSTEDFSTLFWQVSTCLVDRITGMAKSVALLAKNEREQLTKARKEILAAVADRGDSPTDTFHEKKALHAICELSAEEFNIAVAHFSDEQRELWRGADCREF